VTCREFTERLADHLDGTLPQRSDRAERRHAARCRSCRHYRAHYRTTVNAVRALAEWDAVETDEVVDFLRLLSEPAKTGALRINRIGPGPVPEPA
jgi:anti-sigma factor RsiW